MRSKKNNVIVIALSVTVCHFSALTFLGVPADVYRFGAFYWWTCLSMILVVILTAYIYLPVFFNLEIVSIYEYLERRFDRKTKLLSSFLFVLAEALYSPLVIYTPSLAFSAATGINVHIITSVMCGICVCYTAIGGLKAVIWTDFLQFIVIVATMLFIIFIGLQTQGGFLSVWNTAIVGQRLDIFDMSVVVTVAILTGLSIYDRYVKCDPLISKTIEKHDQIVPYYILDVTGNMNGISGVFMGTIFCAALSSLSSGFNATSNVIYKDFLTLFLKRNISKRKVTNILQLIVVVAGLFAVMMGFLVEHLGELVPLTISVTGMVSGPSMGIYTLGMMFPKANSNGAFYGALGGILGSAAFLVPKEYYQYHNLISYPHKPLSTENCNSNLTFFSSLDNKTVSESLIYFALSMSVVATVCTLTGLLIYDRYVKCDPLISKTIAKQDQIVPYYILDVTGNMNGISGIFMGTIFCSALSSLSSGLNAMSSVIYKDFVTLFLKRNISKRKETNILRLIVVIAGLFAVVMGFLVEHLGELVPLTISLTGMVAGPSMGMFTLGVLFPKANSNGAFYGALGGILGSAALVVPREYYQYQNLFSYSHKPLGENCIDNITFLSTLLHNKTVPVENAFQPHYIFRISFYYFCLIGVVITVGLGLIVSSMSNKNDLQVDKKLISPVCHFLLPKQRGGDDVMEHCVENQELQEQDK
ncbi:Putative sodium-dependent multivitamin transporter-like Protein [Tribolium castaneum]|uniref:Sodium-dependent multivitamin transporter-like Protein n=1 Tax=Tribolium castaneum TaxID=7070 RepID=D6WH58_TRICA|nr:Putative sodium-dependent multivitamin transporter-like Protein [Tribolium castaneum]